MGRLGRKKWTNKDMGYIPQRSISSLIDNMFKSMYRINEEEYDRITEIATDEEISLLLEENPSFSHKRKVIHILNKYINY
jgi:hypothetical protein